MSSTISGSGFPHGCLSGQSLSIRPLTIRPPWALPEQAFIALCSGCGGCRDECPRGLLQKGADGFPVIDFSQGGCDFCGECVDACARGALTRRYHGAGWGPWRIKAVIGADCLNSLGIACRQCVELCRLHAIQMSSDLGVHSPVVDLQRCNGCGACLSECPAAAIGLFEPGFG